jgi:tRNA 2-thiocytidine biosynthesis protein TtcA
MASAIQGRALERTMLEKLEKKLLGKLAQANKDFELFGPGDRIMVGVSGGKDSYSLMVLLREVQRRVPWDFEIIGVNLDQAQPGFPAHIIEDWFKAEGFDYRMLRRDTYSIVLEKVPEGKTYCSLCSRLRRGILYRCAQELGATKMALGHHREDLIETLLLNLFYSGQLKTMPPKLHSDDGRNTVIRPLAYCAEEDIAEYARLKEFPIVPCNLCGSQDGMKRQEIKALLNTLHAANPKVKGNLLAALSNVQPTHLLDRKLLSALVAAEAVEADPMMVPRLDSH